MWLASAKKRPLGQQTEPLLKRKDVVCIHTMVGYLSSTDDMFKEGGYSGTESHFGIGGKWGGDAPNKGDLDGVVYQWQDTNREADANLEGGDRVLSIETADNAPKWPKDIVAWTPKQVKSIVNLIAELCELYDIPPVLIPDTKPSRRGLAYHAQGCTPNIVAGGEAWSLAKGKECPGPVRIKQFKSEIIPAVQAKLKTTDVKDVIDMKWDDRVPLTEKDAEVWNEWSKTTKYKKGSLVSVSEMLRYPTLLKRVDLKLSKFIASQEK
jgi:N-acetylmuramoyl-L-alanine amidase